MTATLVSSIIFSCTITGFLFVSSSLSLWGGLTTVAIGMADSTKQQQQTGQAEQIGSIFPLEQKRQQLTSNQQYHDYYFNHSSSTITTFAATTIMDRKRRKRRLFVEKPMCLVCKRDNMKVSNPKYLISPIPDDVVNYLVPYFANNSDAISQSGYITCNVLYMAGMKTMIIG